MKKISLLVSLIACLWYGNNLKAQIYLSEDFEAAFTGSPSAPTGWTQTRLVLLGDGNPEAPTTNGEKDWERNTNIGPATWSISSLGIFPNAAVSGSNVLFMNEYYFGSTANAFGNRRMETPNVNLSSSTSPYVRFWLFSGSTADRMQLRVVASNDGGNTWNTIMWVAPNAEINTTFSSSTPWQRINVKIPSAFMVANAKFGLEFTNGWGVQNYFIDDFVIEEFTPTTITSAGTGLWSNPATWVGGIVPTANNDVVISPGHSVTIDFTSARCQNITVDGFLQYSTTTSHFLHVLGNMTVSPTGTFFSGNGTAARKTFFGGNIVNNGLMNFQPGTSILGTLMWVGYTGNYSGSGTLFNNRVPVVIHMAQGGVSYSNPFTISNTCALYLGVVNANNLTLGNPPASAAFTTERAYGSFTNTPIFNNTNVSQRNLSFLNSASMLNCFLALPQVVLSPGEEVELISGNRQVTGNLTMNTHNNIQLNYPMSVGTFTGTQNISLTRGIIITNTTNLLTLNSSATGATGAIPSTINSDGTNGGNHGSYVAGPIRIIFPTAGTTARNFPLGEGTAFHNNTPSSNVNRSLALAAGVTAWNSQTITATIEGAPSGLTNAPVNVIMGSRAYRLNMNGGPGLAASNVLTMRFNNSTFGGSDNLIGNLQDIRIVQAPSLSGPWTERSVTSGSGLIVNNTIYTRSNATAAPGPINNGDEYFAWGSTGAAIDMSAAALVNPPTISCYGPNQTVSVRVTNSGIAPMDFSVNNATVSCDVAGAVTQTFAPVVLNSGTLAVGASQTVVVTNTFNMSTVGTYSFNANITTAGDVVTSNNDMPVATRTVVAALPFPYSQDFNASLTLPAGMVASGNAPFQVLANHGNNYNNNAMSRNLYSTFSLSIVDLPKLGQATSSSFMTYDYRYQDWFSYPSSPATSLIDLANDSLNIYVSTDCGITYSLVQSVNASNHTPTVSMTTKTVNLGAFSGSDIIIRFLAKKVGGGDYYIDIDNINVCSGPPAAPPSSGSLTCSGSAVTLTTSVGGTALWYATSTPTSAIATGTTYTSPILTSNTTYYVMDSTSCGNSTLTAVNVTVSPAPSLTVSSNPTAVCIGNTATLTAAGAQTYSWSTTATTSVINVSPSVTTIYTVTGSSPACADDTKTISLTVNPNPTVSIAATPTAVCQGNSAVLNASGASTYTWNTSATTTSINVTPSVTTSYTVTGTDANACSSSATVNLVVNSLPSVSLTAASSTVCVGGSTIALTGSPSGGVYSGSNVSGSSFNPATAGTFNPVYSYTDAATGCSNSATTTVLVINCTGLDSKADVSAYLKVYPNPNNGKFTVYHENKVVDKVQVLDVTGRIVHELKGQTNRLDVQLDQLANGVYYLKVSAGNEEEVVKLIKQ